MAYLHSAPLLQLIFPHSIRIQQAHLGLVQAMPQQRLLRQQLLPPMHLQPRIITKSIQSVLARRHRVLPVRYAPLIPSQRTTPTTALKQSLATSNTRLIKWTHYPVSIMRLMMSLKLWGIIQFVRLVYPHNRFKPLCRKLSHQHLTVRYERMVPLLIEAIKELRAEINELKKEN